jgi:valyl-tRNA synthetase
MNCEGQDCGLKEHTKAECQPGGSARRLHAVQPGRPLDRSLLQKTEAEVAKGFAEYRLDNVANTIYDFVWNEFCDWYLEIAKVQIQTGTEAQQRATRRTLIRTLEAILRLAHPIIPFITEALWQVVAPVAGLKGESVSIARYPQAQPERSTRRPSPTWAASRPGGRLPHLRGEMNVSPSTRLPLYAVGDADFMRGVAPVLQALAKLSEVKVFDDEAAWAAAAQAAPVAVVGEARLCLHMEIDVAAEKARLSKEIARIEGEIAKANGQAVQRSLCGQGPRRRARAGEKARGRLWRHADPPARPAGPPGLNAMSCQRLPDIGFQHPP